jgi:ubiquinone/menaquinone biosynthesis C-methylase UbiE
MSQYENIQPSGGSTGASLNLNRRLALISKYFSLKNKHILDSGCGEGQYVLKFFDYSPHVYGVEYASENVKRFQSLGLHPDHVRQGDIEKLAFADQTFDMVLLNEVLEHVPHDWRALAEAERVLKPGGFLAVFSPNRLYPFETHAAEWKKTSKKIPYYFPFIPYLPLGFGRRFLTYHARNYFPWELRRMVRKAGFTIRKQTAIWQTFENISGSSPALVRSCSRFLRACSFMMEKIPLIKLFGVSQVIFAHKATGTGARRED